MVVRIALARKRIHRSRGGGTSVWGKGRAVFGAGDCRWGLMRTGMEGGIGRRGGLRSGGGRLGGDESRGHPGDLHSSRGHPPIYEANPRHAAIAPGSTGPSRLGSCGWNRARAASRSRGCRTLGWNGAPEQRNPRRNCRRPWLFA